MSDSPPDEFRPKSRAGWYANAVSEKAELPELEANENVTKILYNEIQFG